MVNETGVAHELKLRVSVATLDRVVFAHQPDGIKMLALERRATAAGGSGGKVRVRAKPFGGGVRILNPGALQALIGPIQYDSERSQSERDFRILVVPSNWEAVKRYCLQHLENPADPDLESLPDRELVEEFAEDLGMRLHADQYSYWPAGFVIENDPTPTDYGYAPGLPTVRIYRIFEVRIRDDALGAAMLAASQRCSDQDAAMLALQAAQGGGKGRFNTVLTLPLDLVTQTYLALPHEKRYQTILAAGHALDESVPAVLERVEIPQQQRV